MIEVYFNVFVTNNECMMMVLFKLKHRITKKTKYMKLKFELTRYKNEKKLIYKIKCLPACQNKLLKV